MSASVLANLIGAKNRGDLFMKAVLLTNRGPSRARNWDMVDECRRIDKIYVILIAKNTCYAANLCVRCFARSTDKVFIR